MKKMMIIFLILLLMMAAACGQPETQVDEIPTAQASPTPQVSLIPKVTQTQAATLEPTVLVQVAQTPTLSPKKDWVTVFVAMDGYHEGEFDGVADALSGSGYRMDIVSTQTGQAKGMGGGHMDIEKTIVEVDDIGLGIVVVGGTGVTRAWDNDVLLALVRRANETGGVVAGICAGPGVLANAGVLVGRNACWYDGPNTNAVMAGAGCVNSGQAVTIDGNAITASGPSAAKEFGQAIVECLEAM